MFVELEFVYQAVIVAKLSYASPAWWGFSSAADRCRIQAFLRLVERFNFQTASTPSFNSICALANITFTVPAFPA
jgi:hypothetical protein